MSLRFFVPPELWKPEQPRLSEEESHHAADVLRLREGDTLTLFNGRGEEQTVRVRHATRRHIDLEPGPVTPTPPLPCRIHLFQAIPKGRHMDLIVQKATELGAATIHPVISARTIVRLDEGEAHRKQGKWQRTAIEACKQCGRNHLPEVAAPLPMNDALAHLPTGPCLTVIASLLPGSPHLREVIATFRNENGSPPGEVAVWIGPEGDFTPAEVNAAIARGARPAGLGPIILRSETAALFALSALAYELQN